MGMKLKPTNIIFTVFLLLTFFAGIYVLYTNKIRVVYEPLTPIRPTFCPDTLAMRDDGKIILFNQDSPNDFITFLSMDDYQQYLDVQEKQGVVCPALELKQLPPNNYGTKENPAVVVDAARESAVYNGSGVPSFDSHDQDIGVYSDLDKVHDNPMYSLPPGSNAIQGSSWTSIETDAANRSRQRFS